MKEKTRLGFAISCLLFPCFPAAAAVTLGVPSSPGDVSDPCASGGPPMTVDIESDFTIIVRNCSGGEAGSLVDLFYSNPGGIRSDST